MEEIFIKNIVNSVVFSILGIVVLLSFYLMIERITPENTWFEIVKNKNVAVAIVLAALILGISIIIAASIHG